MYFIPRKSLVCERMFQEEGVSANVTIREFPLHFIPFDFDLLSLELESSFQVGFSKSIHFLWLRKGSWCSLNKGELGEIAKGWEIELISQAPHPPSSFLFPRYWKQEKSSV